MNVSGFLLQDETGQEYLVNLLPLSGSKLVSFMIHYRESGAWRPLNRRSTIYSSVQAKAMAALMKFSVQVGGGNVVITAHPSEEEPPES